MRRLPLNLGLDLLHFPRFSTSAQNYFPPVQVQSETIVMADPSVEPTPESRIVRYDQ